ncbi:zinc finger CCCH domain-containing protein 3 [Prorops nasuta]|uniref:zinc finger CCCH domain-containing protein 3 n=1 Tax=Prorops nasuta TaxID=863751 RepID=UPI0034CE8950
MEGNIQKEIDYLTRLIDQHKNSIKPSINLIANSNHNIDNSLMKNNIYFNSHFKKSKFIHTKTRSTTPNVHVNPNFKPHNLQTVSKVLIHVNPKLINKTVSCENNPNQNDNTTEKQTVGQVNVKKSVYVNPQLMSKIQMKIQSDKQKVQIENQPTASVIASPVNSRLKFVRHTESLKSVTRKNNNSSIIILSKRKLVRDKRATKLVSGSTNISLCKLIKNTQLIPKRLKVNISQSPKIKEQIVNTGVLQLPNNKLKLTKYKLDRTASKPERPTKSDMIESKKSKNRKMELITIEGVVYKSSKNRLVRRSYTLKRKRLSNSKNEKFVIASNGKTLHRLKAVKNSRFSINSKLNLTIKSTGTQKLNLKRAISDKVKQRSIQILRNKMSKNNQPCLIFQRFGFCANHKNGKCLKLHDKKQVSLCKKFLQGKCLLDICPLSHDIGPEKMPTCKYFLEGCCMRDSCPYLHVKVSSNTPICIEFLKGYCAKGIKCVRRHDHVCPEYEKTAKCSKGKYCPYPHKNSSSFKKSDKKLDTKLDKSSSNNISIVEIDLPSQENRLRYYEKQESLNETQSNDLTENMEKKRERLLRQVKIMKQVENTRLDPNLEPNLEINENNTEISEDAREFYKRPALGILPSYIPI